MLIKIDRRTIIKNPNAGSTATPVTGRVETTALLECIGQLPFAIRNVTHTSGRVFSNGKCRYNVYLDPKVDIEKVKSLAAKYNVTVVNYTQVRDVQFVTHPAEPPILYKHEDAELECEDCKAKFSIDELASEGMVINEDGDESYNDRVCPHCSKWDCCEIVYEKLSDIPKEELKHQNTVLK